ncbi:Ribokinase-like protein [Paraphysoderma sedebokerense]|nr:Ribokinase-like protein [Paraphysoderma sedebokerense]
MEDRVLSIQSHVVSGYVGNKCATFPLQTLGFHVDALNTVHFSNHTGYPHFKGTRYSLDDILNILDGLELNGLNNYTHLLTGYLGSVSTLEAVEEVVKRLRKKNPKLIYVLDPVLGDNGRLYVPQELVDLYSTKLLPHSDLITPNCFEAELLSKTTIDSIPSAISALKILHAKNIPQIVITSLNDPMDPSNLVLLASSISECSLRSVSTSSHSEPTSDNGTPIIYKVTFKKIEGMYFTGTGDLFAALLLAYLSSSPPSSVSVLTSTTSLSPSTLDSPSPLAIASAKAVSTMQKVLNRTLSYYTTHSKLSDNQGEGKIDPAAENARIRRLCELRLIQSRKDIEIGLIDGDVKIERVK